jgi:hypothetical protein
MSYVEFSPKDLKRLLSILSEHFGKKPMTDDDMKLRQKIEVMHEAETEWEKE